MRNTMSKRVRRLLLGAGLTLSAVNASAQADITVKFYSGADQSYSIDGSGKLSFTSTDLVIMTTGGSATTNIPLAIISKVIFATTTTPTAVNEATVVKNDLSLYPNPSSGSFSIHGGGANSKAVRVFNPTGQQVLSGNYASGESISISTFPAGIYIVNVDNQVFKLVIY